MTKRILKLAAVLAGATGCLVAQDTSKQPPPTVVVPKGKQISAAERNAIKKIQDAKTPDERIAAVDAFVTSFPDSMFKASALFEAAGAADQKADYAKAVSYAKLSLEADPTRFDAMLLIAGELAQHTQKFDLDKEQKLGEAQKDIKQALDLISTAAKPANTSEADWTAFKKDETSEAHKDLGLVATAGGKWDVAVTEFKAAIEAEATPDMVLMARLGNAYNETKQYTEAIAVLNKVEALPNLDPRVKAFADSELARAKKGAGGEK